MTFKIWRRIIKNVSSFEMREGLTSFVNPYSMLVLKNHPLIASQVDKWHVDGISLVKQLNKYGNLNVDRVSFDDTSIAPVVFKYAKKNSLKVAIVGTKEEIIPKAVKVIEGKYDLKISYYRSGYFKDNSEREKCISLINDLEIDLVICGMGTPYQEYFLIDLKKSGWKGYGFTCGGYLHQIARKENYYPVFFDKLNIRWIYRIIDEPKLFKRYAVDYARFFLTFYMFKNYKVFKINSRSFR